MNQCLQCGLADQRNIAAKYEHPMIVGNHRKRLGHCVSGSELLRLFMPGNVSFGKGRSDFVPAMAKDDVYAIGAE